MSKILETRIADKSSISSIQNNLVRQFLPILLTLTLSIAFVQTALAQGTFSLVDGKIGHWYEVQLATEGGGGRVTWAEGGGTWDFGLRLNSDGKLSGTPNKAGEFTLVVKVSDESNQVTSQAFTVKILPAPKLRILPPEQVNQSKEPELTSSNSDSATITVSNVFDPINMINPGTGAVQDPNKLIESLIGRRETLKVNDYCVVHVVKWNNYDGKGEKYESDEYWYLYQKIEMAGKRNWIKQTNQGGKRIYGSSRVAVLIIHLDALPTWDIKYNVKVAGKIPTPLQNLLELVSAASFAGKRERPTKPADLWGGKLLDNITEIPSDLTVQGNTMFLIDERNQTQQPKEFERVYDNEGRYHWDVSVGLPFKQVEDLQYEFNPTNSFAGVVTLKQETRQNAYGFFNVFLNPKGVDLKGSSFLSSPHLVFGLPIAGKPLDRPAAGVGMGIYKYPIKFNFFVGAVFNRVQSLKTLQPGDVTDAGTFNNNLQYRRVTKLIFGVNLPVRQFADALKK